MNCINKELFDSLTDYAYVCAASYEARTITAATFVGRKPPAKAYVFHAVDCCPEIDRSVMRLQKLFEGCELCETWLRDPVSTARNIGEFVELIVRSGVKEVLIDITTFTHEQLLILLKILWLKKLYFTKIICVYVHSREYACGYKEREKWLSKGCREIRSVIGYPGMMLPGQPMVLMVLAGFEYERAVALITQMEPDLLKVGIGRAADIESEWHKSTIEVFERLLQDFCAFRDNVEKFEFKSYDMDEAGEILKREVQKVSQECNLVVVPMNTKLSTLALARLAMDDPRMQVCYAQPDEYNINAYSLPGDRLTFSEFC